MRLRLQNQLVPSPDDYLRAIWKVLSVSLSLLSLALSGYIIVHSSLRISASEEHPDTQIHVVDTLSALVRLT